jgi:predicted amidohydrolase
MAGASGADIVLSVENIMPLGSFGCEEKFGLHMALMEEIPGPTTDALAKISKKYRMYIAANYHEREGSKAYNTTVLIGRDGRIAGKYRKVHLPAGEHWPITPGTEYPVYKTDIGMVGFSTCHDIAFPEHHRIMALNGANIILHSTGGWGFVTHNGSLGLELLRVRSAENFVYTATAYTINKLRPGSSSNIIDTVGDVLAENTSQTEDGIAIAEVTPDYDMMKEHSMWSFMSNVPSQKARLLLERKPHTYGTLTEPVPAVIKDNYAAYAYAFEKDDIAPLSRDMDAFRQAAFDKKSHKLMAYDW